MTTTASAATSGTVAVPLERAFALGTPMTPVGFYPEYGPLPAVTAVENQTGPWDARGQTRRLLLSDGGWVVETLVEVSPPRRFVYELSDFQRVLGRLVTGGRAEWTYSEDPDGAGTRILWSYSFFARPGRGMAVRAVVGLFWAPYMRRVLPRILAEIARLA